MYTNNSNTVEPVILAAIKTRDADALEAMMCLNIKQNVDDLPGKIREFLDGIEGTIISVERRGGGGAYSESRGNGKRITQIGMDFTIKTTTKTYLFIGVWEVANSFAPKEVGFRSINLKDLALITEGYVGIIIWGPEGGMGWHN